MTKEYTTTDLTGITPTKRALLFLLWRDGFDMKEKVNITKLINGAYRVTTKSKPRPVRTGIGEERFLLMCGKEIDGIETWVFHRHPRGRNAPLALDRL